MYNFLFVVSKRKFQSFALKILVLSMEGFDDNSDGLRKGIIFWWPVYSTINQLWKLFGLWLLNDPFFFVNVVLIVMWFRTWNVPLFFCRMFGYVFDVFSTGLSLILVIYLPCPLHILQSRVLETHDLQSMSLCFM